MTEITNTLIKFTLNILGKYLLLYGLYKVVMLVMIPRPIRKAIKRIFRKVLRPFVRWTGKLVCSYSGKALTVTKYKCNRIYRIKKLKKAYRVGVTEVEFEKKANKVVDFIAYKVDRKG